MAFSVTYNGNGSDGGSPPVDPHGPYNSGETVNVQPPGSMTKTGAIFAYWNTKADGSGIFHGWPQDTSFPMPAANVTLYAQWFVTTGLTNGGVTAHYKFSYDSSLQSSGLEPTRTNALVNNAEGDYTWMVNLFPGVTPAGPSPIPVYVTRLNGGANNTGDIRLKPNTNNAAELRCYLVSEITESFMYGQNKGWGFLPGVNNEESCGEGLSLFLTQQFALSQGFANPYTGFTASTANVWLNSSLPTSDPNSTRYYDGPTGFDYGPRSDYVNSVRPYFGNGPGTGCSILFIYYLYHQFGFTIPQIIAAAPGYTNNALNATAPLRGVYQNLTGDAGDPFPFFKQLLGAVFPSNATSSIPGSNPDDPFPLARVEFVGDKTTFGKDEVQDIINTQGGKWENAFFYWVDGFSENSFNALGVTIPPPTGTFANLSGVTISQHPGGIYFENGANPQAPQRVRVYYDIAFNNASLGDFPASGSDAFELDAFLAIGGTKVPGSDTSGQFELVAGADPYFTNVDRNQNNVYYLSQDLRVFTATPAQNNAPVPGGPAFVSDSLAGAFGYIKDLLLWLNNNYSDPASADPFNALLPGQGSALQGDSSVTPFTVDFSNIFSPKLDNNYNFAIARVRLRGTAGPEHAAKNVRVFFRLWSTETADTDYQTGSTYPSTLDTAGLPGMPLVGIDHHTLPFFATGNFSGNIDYGAGGANTRDIQISAGKDSIWAYYGCFLNLYDLNNMIDGRPVQAWLNGTHHCIVAQIASDDAPIVAGTSPESSDKLAQRNLQFTLSDNPGDAATHRIPQTFDIRPSAAIALGDSAPLYPDELMIDWGTIPPGSIASIYWPQVLASDVLTLASALYSSHTLSLADTHTIQCNVTGGVTYIPIPTGTDQNFAGLFTVDLPTTVVTGQEFNVVVRRISTRQIPPPPKIDLRTSFPSSSIENPKPGEKPKAVKRLKGQLIEEATRPELRSWRYVVGTFQVKIPVATKETMLFPEENTLAIMKWRLQQMAPSSRWYPVLERYISYIAARIDGLGGDSGSILPSPQGVPVKQISEGAEHEFTGKVCEVIFDCFGDFEGFVLDVCDDKQTFKTREHGIREIVLRACQAQLLLSVYVSAEHKHRIRKLIIRC